MAGDQQALVWCDIRKNIEVLQLIVSLKQQDSQREENHTCKHSKSTEITVSASNVVVKTRGKSSQQKHVKEQSKCDSCTREIRVAFPDIKVDPMSCNGLSLVQDKELQMRLHINNMQSIQSYDAIGYKNIEEERQTLQQGPTKMVCKICGNTIIKKRHFRRVLELPSEHWQQASQNLCCHGNVSNLSSLQQASLNPAENDCLLGTYFILIHAEAVEAKHLIITQGETVIKCHRCSRPIGEIVIRTDGTGDSQVKGIRINKHTITTQDINVFKNYTTEVYLSRLLLSNLQGRVNFKFLVKGISNNGETKNYVLLWILNADAAVVTNICPPVSKSMEHLHLPKQCTNHDPTQASVTNGLKILYKILINSTIKDIKKTSGRDTISLPAEMCLQLLLILTASTHSIPPSIRQMEGFLVGYLRS